MISELYVSHLSEEVSNGGRSDPFSSVLTSVKLLVFNNIYLYICILKESNEGEKERKIRCHTH